MTYTLIPLKVLCLLTIFCLYGSLSYASVNSKPFVVPDSNNGQEKMVISLREQMQR